MELRHLRYFVAVASDEHLGKAARRLHVSPSPLSRQIRQLEDEVGVPLFERVGRGVRLTHAGSVFLVEARQILAAVAGAVTRAQSAVPRERGELSIGFVDTATHIDLLSEIITRFRARHGSVGVKLLPMSVDELWAGLRARDLDAAFTCATPNADDLRSELVFTERVMLVVPREHRLASHEAVRASELADESFIWITCSDHGRPDRIREALLARGVTPRIAMRSQSATAGLKLVASGIGLSFALESKAASLPEHVVMRPLADVHIEVSGLWAWAAALDDSLLLRSLRDVSAELRSITEMQNQQLAKRSGNIR